MAEIRDIKDFISISIVVAFIFGASIATIIGIIWLIFKILGIN